MSLIDSIDTALAQLQTLDDISSEARKEVRLLEKHLKDLRGVLDVDRWRIALIGPPGIGKSSLLAAAVQLYIHPRPPGGAPLTIDQQRAETLVTVGGGRSTAYTVLVRPPAPTEPPDKIGIKIKPLSVEETKRLIHDVAAGELHSRRGLHDPDSRPDPVGEEVRRALLNATGYGERVEVVFEGNLRRARRMRPLDEVITPDTLSEALAERLLAGLGARSRDYWTFSDTPEGRTDLRALFERINIGTEPDAALPDEIELIAPALSQSGMELVDTRGLDTSLTVRSDLMALLMDPCTVPVFCGAFTNAPSEDLQQLLRTMHEDPALHPALSRGLVVLIDKGEAAAVVDAGGDRELGKAIRLEQCSDRLKKLEIDQTSIRVFDPLLDNGLEMLGELTQRMQTAKTAVEERARQGLSQAEGLIDREKRALGEALDELLVELIKESRLSEAPDFDPITNLGETIRSCPYARRIQATLLREGQFKNLHLFEAAASAARAAGERWFGPTRSALLKRLAADQIQARFPAEVIRARREAILYAISNTIAEYGEAVAREMATQARSDRVWRDALAEFPRGTGFRERAATHFDRWGARQAFRAHRETRLAELLPIYHRALAPEEAPGFTLTIENLRRLRQVRWSLQGLNLLIGANGAGKSTLLAALRFFADVLRDGPGVAAARLGAARTLRTWGSPADATVTLTIHRGPTSWAFTLLPTEQSRVPVWREVLAHHGEEILSVNEAGRMRYRGDDIGVLSTGSGLGHLLRAQKVDLPLTRVADLARGIRAHRVFNLHQIKAGGTAPLPERPLEDDGGNALAVLYALKSGADSQRAYEFILNSLRIAFPAMVEDLSFRLTEHSVEVSVHAPGGGHPLYIGQQSDGLLQYLACLIAVVSARPGDVVALDQPEDGLHPFAAKSLIASLEEWAWSQKLTVILATHSLVLLDTQAGSPDRVFVMKTPKDGEPCPAPLTALFDTVWLSGYKLGELYANDNAGSNADGE